MMIFKRMKERKKERKKENSSSMLSFRVKGAEQNPLLVHTRQNKQNLCTPVQIV
jgi:hypothetical protein